MEEFTYKNSGVDIEKADELISEIKDVAKSTNIPGVLGGIGAFASLFELDLTKYPKPVLVSGTDGVGTKLEIAIKQNNFTGIGQDLVAMCVNDTLTVGAKPLFFLDYFATGKLDVKQSSEVIKSIARACKDIGCALVGGETAEMPGFYKDGDFDIAGFNVGVVNKDKIITGESISPGDVIIGLPSTGLHSNGYSLARKIVKDKFSNDLSTKVNNEKQTLGELLLVPTKLYVNEILDLFDKVELKGLAHITGGGLTENVPRVLPKNVSAEIDLADFTPPVIFDFLQEHSGISDSEMFKTFNCGIGMVVIVKQEDSKTVLENSDGLIIGKITALASERITVKK